MSLGDTILQRLEFATDVEKELICTVANIKKESTNDEIRKAIRELSGNFITNKIKEEHVFEYREILEDLNTKILGIENKNESEVILENRIWNEFAHTDKDKTLDDKPFFDFQALKIKFNSDLIQIAIYLTAIRKRLEIEETLNDPI
jgi:hypothetical protein